MKSIWLVFDKSFPKERAVTQYIFRIDGKRYYQKKHVGIKYINHQYDMYYQYKADII